MREHETIRITYIHIANGGLSKQKRPFFFLRSGRQLATLFVIGRCAFEEGHQVQNRLVEGRRRRVGEKAAFGFDLDTRHSS